MPSSAVEECGGREVDDAAALVGSAVVTADRAAAVGPADGCSGGGLWALSRARWAVIG